MEEIIIKGSTGGLIDDLKKATLAQFILSAFIFLILSAKIYDVSKDGYYYDVYTPEFVNGYTLAFDYGAIGCSLFFILAVLLLVFSFCCFIIFLRQWNSW